MRKIILLGTAIGMTGMLLAADPIVGTWKLDVRKSKFPQSQQAPPKEETRVIRELDADQLQSIVIGTRTDGSPISNKLTWPQNGGDVKFEGASFEDIAAVAKTTGPGEWHLTIRLTDKQTTMYQVVVSRDGKTMRETIKGTDASGKSFEGLLVFEKQ